MINWKNFETLRVVKKIRTIVGQWWDTDIIFIDDNGDIQNFTKKDIPKFNNKIFDMIVRSSRGLESLEKFFKKDLIKQDASLSQLITWEDTGLKFFYAPIHLDSTFMGFVVACAFLTDKATEKDKDSLYKKLRDFGYTTKDIQDGISNASVIKKEELLHFNELVSLVASEIETLHEEISLRENKISELNKELGTRYRYNNMIGKSSKMQELYSLMDKIKNSTSTVLIQGENGTGKELIAKAIHYNSPRKDKVFIIQNCSAFNDNLLESELFGHVKGSFTGAVKDKKGLFEMANGGTFFLDEIGDMTLSMQVKILRVLQEGTFIPVGATEPRKVDVRIIAATNKNLKEMIAKGEFREDLYYRINVINIAVPALKERKEDIPLLADFFLEKNSQETKTPKKKLSQKLLTKLMEHDWPGNIRELENEIERLIVLAGDEKIIELDLLSDRISSHQKTEKKSTYSGSLKDAIEALERDMITEGLKRNGWNKSKLAKELGISRASLISKVERYELDKRRTR